MAKFVLQPPVQAEVEELRGEFRIELGFDSSFQSCDHLIVTSQVSFECLCSLLGHKPEF